MPEKAGLYPGMGFLLIRLLLYRDLETGKAVFFYWQEPSFINFYEHFCQNIYYYLNLLVFTFYTDYAAFNRRITMERDDPGYNAGNKRAIG